MRGSDIDGALSLQVKWSGILHMAATEPSDLPGIPIFSFWHRTVGFLALGVGKSWGCITIEPSL